MFLLQVYDYLAKFLTTVHAMIYIIPSSHHSFTISINCLKFHPPEVFPFPVIF